MKSIVRGISATVCVATIILAAGFARAQAAAAGDTHEAMAITVDIEEHRGREVVARASYVLPIAGERNWVKLHDAKDFVTYDIELGREGIEQGAPTVAVNVARRAGETKLSVDQWIRATVRLGKSGRVLAGHLERDGTSTDVYLSRR